MFFNVVVFLPLLLEIYRFSTYVEPIIIYDMATCSFQCYNQELIRLPNSQSVSSNGIRAKILDGYSQYVNDITLYKIEPCGTEET